MNMNEAIASVFKNYANFNGRARRSEYWYFILLDVIIHILSSVILFIYIPIGLTCISIWWIATLLPRLAVKWRRLHDTGKSGLWVLLSCTGIGAIVLLVWFAEDSSPGDNIYGPNPKGVIGGGIINNGNYPIKPQKTGYAVQCLSGPLQGQTYPLGQGLTFGTDVSSSVRFPIGTPGVSRNHCRILWNNGSLVLIDDGSTYGTYVDVKKLPPQYPERISQGTRFCLGGQGVMFQLISVQL